MKYDLIVIGTGFASTFFLHKYLSKASPASKILVLERGIFENQEQRINNARQKPFGKLSYITSSSGNTSTFKNNTPDKPWMFDPNFGGTSYSWTGCTPRFMPTDFKMQSLFQKAMDWPISYEDLDPYYYEAEKIMEVGGPMETPFPRNKPYDLPPHALSTVDRILNKQYGVNYISQPSARATKAVSRGMCCTSVICHLCPTSAKFTIENSLMSVYQDPRIEIQYNAQVHSLETMNDYIKSVHFIKDGKDNKVDGDLVVLGANAIFNPHILLNSGDSNPHTGKYLTDQVSYFAYVHLNDLDNVGGNSKNPANGYMFYDEVDRSKMAASLIETYNDFTLRHEFGKWRKIAKFKFMFDDIPSKRNFVAVSNDPLIPMVNYEGFDPYVNAGYENLKNTIDDVFGVLPVEEIILDSNVQKDGAHILGTTRMSESAKDGTIDGNMVHHQYRNLLVLGSSSFPTASPTNPTLTISALSLRAADKILT